jgi:hypothetical protein
MEKPDNHSRRCGKRTGNKIETTWWSGVVAVTTGLLSLRNCRTSGLKSGHDLYTTVEMICMLPGVSGDLVLDTLGGKIKLKIQPETRCEDQVEEGFRCTRKKEKRNLYVTYSISSHLMKTKELFKLAKLSS